MKKEYVIQLKLLMQMITSGVSEEKVRDQAKKVLKLGKQILSELEDAETSKNTTLSIMADAV